MNSSDGQEDRLIFLSYSHEDRTEAERLARALHERGENVWWDKWQILPGDSLVNKIFEEGLSRADAFVILLSAASVDSDWVREELDVATVQRISGVTRVIPVIIEDTRIPGPLRSLLYVDLRDDFDVGVEKIVEAVHGVRSKPERQEKESLGSKLQGSIAGLSELATTVGAYVLESTGIDEGLPGGLAGEEIGEALKLRPQLVNDAVDELKEYGMVRTREAIGSAPYLFVQVMPTYVLYEEFSSLLDYDPEDDIRTVVSIVASEDALDHEELGEKTALSPGRLNRAVEHLNDYGLAKVDKFMGTAPHRFGRVRATRKTRQLAERQL